jgi:prenylcysteine oxidase/farnesylcysteine lyase
MRLQLGSTLVAWLALGGEVVVAEAEVKTETKGVKNVAIIGELGLGSGLDDARFKLPESIMDDTHL